MLTHYRGQEVEDQGHGDLEKLQNVAVVSHSFVLSTLLVTQPTQDKQAAISVSWVRGTGLTSWKTLFLFPVARCSLLLTNDCIAPSSPVYCGAIPFLYFTYKHREKLCIDIDASCKLMYVNECRLFWPAQPFAITLVCAQWWILVSWLTFTTPIWEHSGYQIADRVLQHIKKMAGWTLSWPISGGCPNKKRYK